MFKVAIVFIGPPGCGKGTQAQVLKKKLNFFVFSTGDELRKEIASGSEFGTEIKKVLDAGDLLPDNMVSSVVKKTLAELPSNNVLFDGFPRTLGQAEELDSLLADGWNIMAYCFSLNKEIAAGRINSRFVCSKCKQNYNELAVRPVVDGVCDVCGSVEFERRIDDADNVIANRFSQYELLTRPIVEFYEKKGAIDFIDASLSVGEVSEKLIESIRRRFLTSFKGE